MREFVAIGRENVGDVDEPCVEDFARDLGWPFDVPDLVCADVVGVVGSGPDLGVL